MHFHNLHSVAPMERYRAIITALEPERESWINDFWLRIAAQIAVLSPDDPIHLAKRIRLLGEALASHARWYQDLDSPQRFVIAAMLIEHHIMVYDFLAEHGRIAALLDQVGLRSSGFHHDMTVLILMISPEHVGCTILEAERLKAIYLAMKRFHWWLTGVDDLPACAALAQCHGSAIEVVTRAEACYQLLHESGLARGEHLQTAANLLPLTGLGPDVAVARYRALKSHLESREGTLQPSHYEVLSLLSLLDHAAETVINRMLGMHQELKLFQPDVKAAANLILAADLTCLDLARFDRAQRMLSGTAGESSMWRSLHTHRIAAAAMVSRIDIDLTLTLTDLSTVGWPQSL